MMLVRASAGRTGDAAADPPQPAPDAVLSPVPTSAQNAVVVSSATLTRHDVLTCSAVVLASVRAGLNLPSLTASRTLCPTGRMSTRHTAILSGWKPPEDRASCEAIWLKAHRVAGWDAAVERHRHQTPGRVGGAQ